jgi:nitroreductase/Pyruvate/2-oxoacid:ferredoxin oxidoreductase delta subunit
MDRPVSTVIDLERCIGCGLCVCVCPSQTLSLKGGKAVITGERSLGCDHCAAVCPKEAVKVTELEPEALRFATFQSDERWLPHGEFDTAQLVRLMRSRRSCRNYAERELDRSILEDLVKIGTTAPSGTNSQCWSFTILPDRPSVLALGKQIGAFFRRLNRLAERRWLCILLKWIGKGELDMYYREYYESVRRGLEDWEQSGRERLFHGAPAAILVGSRPGASCPAEDALLAAQNILLAAHSMGLGTCLIGFAVAAIRQAPRIRRFLGIPAREKVHAVIALGYPDVRYARQAGRRRVEPRIFRV